MKYFPIIILFTIFICSCKSNSQNKGFEDFKSEFSSDAIKKIADNSPYSYEDRVIANCKQYFYFETFGNSGLCVQFNTKNKKALNSLLKQYKILNPQFISFKDSSYVYIYDEKHKSIAIPELSDEFGEISTIKMNDSNQLDIYLMENGKLQNIFLKGDKKMYNYSIGIYNFKNRSTFIYWFLIY